MGKKVGLGIPSVNKSKTSAKVHQVPIAAFVTVKESRAQGNLEICGSQSRRTDP